MLGTEAEGQGSNQHLEAPEIKTPCSENWENMAGDDKRRFCDNCQKDVHNLSAMPQKQAQKLLETAKTELCVRYSLDDSGQVLSLPSRINRFQSFFKHSARVAAATVVALIMNPWNGASWANNSQTPPCAINKTNSNQHHIMGEAPLSPSEKEQRRTEQERIERERVEREKVASPKPYKPHPLMGKVKPPKPKKP